MDRLACSSSSSRAFALQAQCSPNARVASQNHAVPGAVARTILDIISGNLLFVRRGGSCKNAYKNLSHRPRAGDDVRAPPRSPRKVPNMEECHPKPGRALPDRMWFSVSEGTDSDSCGRGIGGGSYDCSNSEPPGLGARGSAQERYHPGRCREGNPCHGLLQTGPALG